MQLRVGVAGVVLALSVGCGPGVVTPLPDGGQGGGGGAGGGTGGGSSAPTVTQLSPSSGYVGTAVTIVGTGFSTTPSNNTIRFNGTTAVVSTASATALQTNVPAGATTGTVSVTVGGQTATSATPFTVLSGNPVPQVASLSPCGGVAGQAGFTLTLNGQGFLSTSTVTFGGASVSTTFVSATQLTANIPASAVATAPSGNVAPVVVTNPTPGGGSSTPVSFGVATATATLAGTVQPIFTGNCASAGCHTGVVPAAGLKLTNGNSYSALVGAVSGACAPKLLVKACAPTRAESVLLDKVLATVGSPACSGTPMPKTGSLTAAEKQALVDWVAQGAPQ